MSEDFDLQPYFFEPDDTDNELIEMSSKPN